MTAFDGLIVFADNNLFPPGDSERLDEIRIRKQFGKINVHELPQYFCTVVTCRPVSYDVGVCVSELAGIHERIRSALFGP